MIWSQIYKVVSLSWFRALNKLVAGVEENQGYSTKSWSFNCKHRKGWSFYHLSSYPSVAQSILSIVKGSGYLKCDVGNSVCNYASFLLHENFYPMYQNNLVIFMTVDLGSQWLCVVACPPAITPTVPSCTDRPWGTTESSQKCCEIF